MLRHGGSQTCAVEGADAPRTSRQERQGVLDKIVAFPIRGVKGRSRKEKSLRDSLSDYRAAFHFNINLEEDVTSSHLPDFSSRNDKLKPE